MKTEVTFKWPWAKDVWNFRILLDSRITAPIETAERIEMAFWNGSYTLRDQCNIMLGEVSVVKE